MSVVHRWVDSFNKGDMKSMGAACADQTSILERLSAPRVARCGSLREVVSATTSPTLMASPTLSGNHNLLMPNWYTITRDLQSLRNHRQLSG